MSDKLRVGTRIQTKYDATFIKYKGVVPAGSKGKIVQVNSTHASIVFDDIVHPDGLPFVYIRPDLNRI